MNIPLLALCDKSYMVELFLILKILFKIACAVVPIVIVISTISHILKAVTSGKDEDIKESHKLLIRKIIAGLIIFLLPSILSYTFTHIINAGGVDMITCFQDATREQVEILRAYEQAAIEEQRILQEIENEKILRRAYEKEHAENLQKQKIFEEARRKFKANQDSVSIAGKALFTPETLAIIQDHQFDFDYRNFGQVINSYGGFQGYVNELGGVFKKYYGKAVPAVTCASDLQEISEYVFGFMYLYGFDYYNGNKYCKWGGECGGNTATNDAFYPSGVKHDDDGLSSPKSDFDSLISGRKKVNMTTNCNWTVDMVYYKAGLFGGIGQPDSSAAFRSMGYDYKIIANAADLQVGDIIHFFRSGIDKNNPGTWHDWYHVAYIGEVNKTEGYVVGYDGGSYFTNNRNFKWRANISSGELHGTKNWVGVRIADIDQTC